MANKIKLDPVTLELQKFQKDKLDKGKQLDEMQKQGISPEQINEFNQLCKDEFNIAVKENLLKFSKGESNSLLPPKIERRITIVPIAGTPPPKKK